VAKRLDSILERFPVVSSRQPVLFSSVPVPAAATRRREGCGGAAEGLRRGCGSASCGEEGARLNFCRRAPMELGLGSSRYPIQISMQCKIRLIQSADVFTNKLSYSCSLCDVCARAHRGGGWMLQLAVAGRQLAQRGSTQSV
jgi:hypothetical protein